MGKGNGTHVTDAHAAHGVVLSPTSPPKLAPQSQLAHPSTNLLVARDGGHCRGRALDLDGLEGWVGGQGIPGVQLHQLQQHPEQERDLRQDQALQAQFQEEVIYIVAHQQAPGNGRVGMGVWATRELSR